MSSFKVSVDKNIDNLVLTSAVTMPTPATFPGGYGAQGIPGYRGDIIFNRGSGAFFGHNGTQWVQFGTTSAPDEGDEDVQDPVGPTGAQGPAGPTGTQGPTGSGGAGIWEYSPTGPAGVGMTGPTVRLDSTNTDYSTTAILSFPSQGTESTDAGMTDQRMIFLSDGTFRAGTVSGTEWDAADRGEASVAFGTDNTASGDQSAVSGGSQNIASGLRAIVSGGESNTADGNYSVVAGGLSNRASGNLSTVVGGNLNLASNTLSAALAGQSLVSSGLASVVYGGISNQCTANYGVVGGGQSNTSEANHSFLGSGQSNIIQSGSNHGFIGSGFSNNISGVRAVIGGGNDNSVTAQDACILGGNTNSVTAQYGAVSGGQGNRVSGESSIVAGGSGNTAAGNYSLCAGREATDNGNSNCFVFGGAATPTVASTGDTFVIGNAGPGATTNGTIPIYIPNMTESTAASAGAIASPGNFAGFLPINIAGTEYKIPLFNA